jgi:ribosomal protein S12
VTSDNALSKAQAQVSQLTTSLSQVQKENKALQAKLASSRSAIVTVESTNAAKTPGSAMKGKVQQRTIMVGSVEAAQAAHVAKLKEDLYSDLTGLILRGVETGDEADVYDCIQTGRNGSRSIFFILSTFPIRNRRESYFHQSRKIF